MTKYVAVFSYKFMKYLCLSISYRCKYERTLEACKVLLKVEIIYRSVFTIYKRNVILLEIVECFIL